MNQQSKFGTLEPVGGGDPIPLLQDKLLVGRRESCDIVLRFANVSAHHCQLKVEHGYWFVKDLNSRNGTRINNARVSRKRLDPGTVIQFAKHSFRIEYDPADLGATGPPPADDDGVKQILGRSLLDRAGLDRRSHQQTRKRYDPTNQDAGQIRDPNKPV